MKAPTLQLSRDLLVATGWRVEKVERWNPAARKMNDLFGLFDIIAIRGAETMGVQTTSKSNLASHVRKMQTADALPDVLAAGWIVMLHGWHQPRGPHTKWEVVETVIDLEVGSL